MIDTSKLNEYHDVALTIQFSLKVSMNVCQAIWNIVIELFSIGKEDYKGAHYSDFMHTNSYYIIQ